MYVHHYPYEQDIQPEGGSRWEKAAAMIDEQWAGLCGTNNRHPIHMTYPQVLLAFPYFRECPSIIGRRGSTTRMNRIFSSRACWLRHVICWIWHAIRGCTRTTTRMSRIFSLRACWRRHRSRHRGGHLNVLQDFVLFLRQSEQHLVYVKIGRDLPLMLSTQVIVQAQGCSMRTWKFWTVLFNLCRYSTIFFASNTL